MISSYAVQGRVPYTLHALCTMRHNGRSERVDGHEKEMGAKDGRDDIKKGVLPSMSFSILPCRLMEPILLETESPRLMTVSTFGW